MKYAYTLETAPHLEQLYIPYWFVHAQHPEFPRSQGFQIDGIPRKVEFFLCEYEVEFIGTSVRGRFDTNAFGLRFEGESTILDFRLVSYHDNHFLDTVKGLLSSTRWEMKNGEFEDSLQIPVTDYTITYVDLQ